jgi:SAM-dependent methyltransferase
MYDQDLADVYDALYVAGTAKDYRAEAVALARLIRDRCPEADSLLDVACGTGEHLTHLRNQFGRVEGLELSAPMRRVAAAKLPDVPIHAGDLRAFDLGRRFDVVTCLFSAIGYVRGPDELRAGMTAMVAHLNPGGVLVVEPWFTPAQWQEGSVHHTALESGGRTVVRLSHSTRTGRTSMMTMHYLVADPRTGIRHFTNEHVMTLFTDEEYLAALAAAGCRDVTAVPGWAEGRPRLVGTAPEQRGRP